MYRLERVTGVGLVKIEALSLNPTPFLLYVYMKNKQLTKQTRYIDDDFIPSLEDQKKDILANFDFNHVTEVMKMNIYKNHDTGECTPWRVFFKDIGFHLPTPERLKEYATLLLDSAINCNVEVSIERFGPFRVTKAFDRLILDFVVESWSYD